MNDMLDRPWVPEWLSKAWNWVDPGAKYILVFAVWTIVWLWLVLWLGNIEHCPGLEYRYDCPQDWLNWAWTWTGILCWAGGAWGMMIQWESRNKDRNRSY